MTQQVSSFEFGIDSKAFTVLACATLFVALAAPQGVTAQPANDTCAGAITIQCGDTVAGSTIAANPETLGLCGTEDGTGGAVWYRFVGNGDRWLVRRRLWLFYRSRGRVFGGLALLAEGCRVRCRVGSFHETGSVCPQAFRVAPVRAARGAISWPVCSIF